MGSHGRVSSWPLAVKEKTLVATRSFLSLRLVLAVFALALLSGRERLRNRLKGQATSGKRGQSVPWKKDCDPALASDAHPLWMALDMVKWTLLSQFGRILMPKLYPPPNLCFYDVDKQPGVRGLVALTVDDCFCRQGEAHSLIETLRQLCAAHGAHLTFFVTSQYSRAEWCHEAVAKLVADGHELANHCSEDREYDKDSAVSFTQDLDETTALLSRLQPGGRGTKWFRAPSGNLSPTMGSILTQKGMTNVMLDCYANDPHITNPGFIAWCMTRKVTHGSILIIHMPERGFREWDMKAIELVLSGLKKRGLRSVTLSELATAAAANS